MTNPHEEKRGGYESPSTPYELPTVNPPDDPPPSAPDTSPSETPGTD